MITEFRGVDAAPPYVKEDIEAMSKRIFSIVLTVCMFLSAPFALAQEDYVPGQTIQSLLNNAFESGQIVGGDFKILFDMNLDVLDPSQEEERAQIDGVMQILEASTLSAGVGKIDGGYRIELSGEYAPSGKQSTSIDAAIELTREGVVVESDLIEGKRLSVTWESVLMMCGVPTDQIQQIMALRDMDLEAQLDQLLEQLAQSAQIIEQVAQPYVTIVEEFLSSLPAEVSENVEAEGIFPAVDYEVTVTVTDEDLSRLFVALLDQLQNDETLVPLIDSLLITNGAEGVDTAMLCEALRGEAEAFAQNGNTYTMMIGYCDEELVAYFLFDVTDADAQSDTVSLIMGTNEEQTQADLNLVYVHSDEEGNAETNAHWTMNVVLDAEDPNVFDMDMNFTFAEGEESISLNYVISFASMETEEKMPGYRGDYKIDMTSSGNGRMVFDMVTEMALTADGGEKYTTTGSADVYENSMNMKVEYAGGLSVAPEGEGITGRYWVNESMKALGLDNIGFDMAIWSKPYEAADGEALTLIELETATQEEIDGLVVDASAAIEEKIATLREALPAAVVEAL